MPQVVLNLSLWKKHRYVKSQNQNIDEVVQVILFPLTQITQIAID